MINSVFNLWNFWDRRASNVFNGVTPSGTADARATVLAMANGRLTAEAVRLDGSRLASQAVGPPLNALEMSFDGRTWTSLGRKMLTLTPLARQTVAADDRVLGPFASLAGTGLRADVSYGALIRASFQPAYWNSPAVIDIDGRVIVDVGQPSRPASSPRWRTTLVCSSPLPCRHTSPRSSATTRPSIVFWLAIRTR